MSEKSEFSLTWWETESIIEIPLPDDLSEIDDDWCTSFNAVYGDGQMKTMVHVSKFHRQILDSRGVPFPGSKKFESRQFLFDDDDARETRPIIGSVSKMIIFSAPGMPDRYHPHLCLKEVEAVGENIRIARHPNQELMIPLGDETSIILYS